MSLKAGGGACIPARKQPIWHCGRCHNDMYSAASEAADNGGAGWSRLDGMSENSYGGHPRVRLIQSDLRLHRINAGWGCGGCGVSADPGLKANLRSATFALSSSS